MYTQQRGKAEHRGTGAWRWVDGGKAFKSE